MFSQQRTCSRSIWQARCPERLLSISRLRVKAEQVDADHVFPGTQFWPLDHKGCGAPRRERWKLMPLMLRPTALGSGIDKDRLDYTVCTGEWEVGRIYQPRGGPDSLGWFWSLTINGPISTLDDRRPGGSQGAVSEEWGDLEGVGEAGRGALRPYECGAQSKCSEVPEKTQQQKRAGRHSTKAGVNHVGDNKLLKSW